MSTQGKKSYGMKISIGGVTSPDSYTKIDEVWAVPPLKRPKTLIDFSNHDDTGSGYRDYLSASLKDGSQIDFQCNEIPGNVSQDMVKTAYDNDTRCYWKIEFPGGRTEIFMGIVIDWYTSGEELDGRQIFGFTLKVIGDVYSFV